jgi:hypothetical protein
LTSLHARCIYIVITTRLTMNAQTTEPMDPRQMRGIAMAKWAKIQSRRPGIYLVPSATDAKHHYTVIQDSEGESCSCPDHELTQARCKHVWAVEYSRRSEQMPDGSVKTEETLKVTYQQANWSAYNSAQCHEKEHVALLLRQLCDGVAEPERSGKGRPPLPLADMIFCAAWKVYGGKSGRRTDTDMREDGSEGARPQGAPLQQRVQRTGPRGRDADPEGARCRVGRALP